MMAFPSAKLLMPQVRKPSTKGKIMCDKSPKAVNKHSTQKQTKTNNAQEKRKQAVAAKQSAGKKK
jgi:hypothetical protein